MSWIWVLAGTAFIGLEAYRLVKLPHRSAWNALKGNPFALCVGAVWWAVAAGAVWANDRDPLGGVIFGGLTGVIVAGAVTSVTRWVQRLRRMRSRAGN